MEPSLVVIGLNLKTASAALRERFAMSDARQEQALRQLIRSEGVDEAIVLATSDRTEFILWASDASAAANSVLRFLTREFDLKLSEWSQFRRLMDEAALVELFRAATGLEATESPKISSQLLAAWDRAKNVGATGRFLDTVVEEAVAVCERAQTTATSGAFSAKEIEQIIAEEAQAFRRRVTEQRNGSPASALQAMLKQICEDELKTLREQYGPFTQDHSETLAVLASHIAQRVTAMVARDADDMSQGTPEQALARAAQKVQHTKSSARGNYVT